MSPLVQQIVQRLELLPEALLQQVLLVVDSLELVAVKGRSQAESQPHQHDCSDSSPSLKKVGHVWIVKAGEPAQTDGVTDIFRVREERIEKLTQW
ncbi:MAG: hypothetical protein HC812_10280 [Leptolyngbya sp. RL_3_1]|nr:hypothetical protein [Leptolyngbya sp. RL_3_1]